MLLAAAERSLERETPFNRFITIAWERGGLSAENSVKATGEFVTAARAWLHGHGKGLDWAWVQESAPGNAHCHILLHVPLEMDALFRPMPRRWVRKLLGGSSTAWVLQSQRLVLCASPRALKESKAAELLSKVHYMLKTTPESLEGPLGLFRKGHKPWGGSCIVYGKRCAVRPRAGGTRT